MTSNPCSLHPSTPGPGGRARHALVAAAVATALGMFSAPGFCADTASAADLQNLQDQIQKLQREVDRMKAQQASAAAAAQSAAAPSPSPASAAAPSPSAAAPGPGLKAGPVTLTFGGFTELATIYRNRNETADVGSNFNTAIPYANSPNGHLSEFRESARQSRISMLAQGPAGGPKVEGYFEMDFLGAAPTANSNESNSYNLRLRHAYATYENSSGFYMLAGQNWSMLTLEKAGMKARAEQIPLTIDAQYVPGFNWTRNAQVRFVEAFNDKISAGVSFESPQALISNNNNVPSGTNAYPANTLFNNAGGSLFYSGQNYSLDMAPDIVAKVAIDPGFGHYEAYGIARWFRDRAAGVNDTVSGGGGGAAAIVPVVPDKLDFQVSFLAGSGIGRYGSAQLPDVTLRPDGKFAAISEYEVLAGLIFRPTSTWTLYAYAGEEHADSKAYTGLVNGVSYGYGYGSPLYDNSGCLTLGSGKCAANTKAIQQGTIGGWWKYYQGALGNLQFGFQGSYTKRQIFAGKGGDPDANLSIAMLSFRYYPYQK